MLVTLELSCPNGAVLFTHQCNMQLWREPDMQGKFFSDIFSVIFLVASDVQF